MFTLITTSTSYTSGRHPSFCIHITKTLFGLVHLVRSRRNVIFHGCQKQSRISLHCSLFPVSITIEMSLCTEKFMWSNLLISFRQIFKSEMSFKGGMYCNVENMYVLIFCDFSPLKIKFGSCKMHLK